MIRPFVDDHTSQVGQDVLGSGPRRWLALELHDVSFTRTLGSERLLFADAKKGTALVTPP